MKRRAHTQCVLKVQLKAYKRTRDAGIKHAFNDRASASEDPLPSLSLDPTSFPNPRFWTARYKYLAPPLCIGNKSE